MQDDRKYSRPRLVNQFNVINSVTNQIIGRMTDLTIGGMMMVSLVPARIGRTFKCRFELPRNVYDGQQLDFHVEAKWCDQIESGGIYQTGYQFVDLTSEDKELIRIILEQATAEGAEPEYPTVFGLDSES